MDHKHLWEEEVEGLEIYMIPHLVAGQPQGRVLLHKIHHHRQLQVSDKEVLPPKIC